MATVKPVGGVRSCELFRPCHVAIARREEGITITLTDGATAAAVPLMEDRSLYTEQLRQAHGLGSIVHELQLTAETADAAPWLGREFLTRAAAEGTVARVEMLSGEVVWVGVSRRFGTSQPLYLTGLEASSELSPRQRPTVRLTLRSEDCDSAHRQTD